MTNMWKLTLPVKVLDLSQGKVEEKNSAKGKGAKGEEKDTEDKGANKG